MEQRSMIHFQKNEWQSRNPLDIFEKIGRWVQVPLSIFKQMGNGVTMFEKMGH